MTKFNYPDDFFHHDNFELLTNSKVNSITVNKITLLRLILLVVQD